MTQRTEYKGYAIENHGTYSQKVIKPLGKGSVHLSLRGAYTNESFAKRAIDVYIGEKVETDGKAD